MLKTVVLVSGLLCVASPAAAQMNPADLKWGDGPATLPAGVKMAVLAGDPGKPGTFVIRLNMPAGYKIPAHHHPTDEYVTVISGSVSFGMGDKLDPAKAVKLEPGAFTKVGAKMTHFALAPEGAIVQVSAQGPFAITYVDPKDDPTRKP